MNAFSQDQFDAGRAPASMPLRCPYCGDGEIEAILEYTGTAYSEHRDCTGFECEFCLAQWEPDGTPLLGPHMPTLARERSKAKTAPAPEPACDYCGESDVYDGYAECELHPAEAREKA